ncbi:MAG: hypothetical protein IKJ55_00940, partial [Clostridia bacterium]|nr:hypothetical protein [Clostridia bacterium]
MDNFNKREELDTEVYPPENTNNNQEYVPQQNYQAPQQNYSEQPSYNAQPNYVAAPYNPYGNADSMENPYGEPAPAPKKKLGLILGI